MTSIYKLDQDLVALRKYASQFRGEELVLFDLDYFQQAKIWQTGKREEIAGLGEAPPIMIHRGRPQDDGFFFSMQVYRLNLADGPLRLVYLGVPRSAELPSLWGVAKHEYPRLKQYVADMYGEGMEQVPPILSVDDQAKLLANTIDFLKRDDSLLRKYRVPKKRGILLRGSPGNGKTMACRWLRNLCTRERFDFETVTVDDYASARDDHETATLFQTCRPGIILFDDFDKALQDRTKFGDDIQSVFLAELDGMSPKEGVVYMFTSNLRLDQIDPAAQRPGRIDLVIEFAPPSAELRQRFIRQEWPTEVVAALGEEMLVNSTEGWSFAELEEARKATVLRWLDGQDFRWNTVRDDLVERRESAQKPIRPVGFGANFKTEPAAVVGPLAERIA